MSLLSLPSFSLRRLMPLLLLLAASLPARVAHAQQPFSERAVTLAVAGGTLYGTELAPNGGAKVPVVLLHAGSGPTDRDGNSAALPGPNNSLRMVAEGLARNGIASLRYDKRMIGASVSPAWKEADLRFDDYIGDAAAWIKYLRADPRFSRVVMAGHSEGALIALAACRQGGADACVSISGIGHPLDEILREQLKPKLPPALFEQSERVLAQLKQGKPVDDAPPELAMLYRPSVQPYLISVIKIDPRAAIAALAMPVLILQGTSDIQVSVPEARALSAAAPHARLVIIDGMNHVLKMVGDDQALQMKSYSSPDLPVSPRLLDALSSFVNAPPQP